MIAGQKQACIAWRGTNTLRSRTRAPLRTLACHCTFCQRMTGTAFYAESLFAIDSVEIEGELRRYAHRSDSRGGTTAPRPPGHPWAALSACR